MSWFITGNRNDIILRASKTGKLSFAGAGKQDCRPIESNFFSMSEEESAFIFKVHEANCTWNIFTEIEPTMMIADGMVELEHRVKSQPEKTHTLVKVYGTNSVGFDFVVPESTFANIQWMIEMLLKSDYLQYVISMPFVGFARENVEIEIPTWKEFVSGKPYFDSEFAFTVKP